MKIHKSMIAGMIGLGLLFSAGVVQAGQSQRTELEQVVVSASRNEQQVQDAISQVYVISAEDIRNRQTANIQDLLRDIPGVRITADAGSWGNGGNVQLMGMRPSQTLILVDGQRFIGGHGSVDISSIPVENIERIEVVKGPGSALYGADAMAGVIHIITRQPGTGVHFRTGLAAGSRERRVATAGLEAGGERLGALLDYTRKSITGVDKDKDKVHSDAFSATLRYQPLERTTLRLKPFYSRQNNQVTGESDRIQTRTGLNASAEIRPDSLTRIQVRGSYLAHDHHKKDRSFDAVNTALEFETGLARLMGRHHVSLGYAYVQEEVDDKHKALTKDNQNTHGVYLQDEINLCSLSLTLGGRLDHHDQWGTEIHPRAGLLFRATDRLRLRASAGTAFAAPTLIRLYADGWRMGPWTMLANPDLKPEKSLSYQAGMDWQVHDTVLIRTSLYRNEIDDLIETVREARTMTYRNISEAITQGVETTLTWRPIAALAITLGYTYMDTENKETGQSLLDRPEHLASLDLDYYLQLLDLRFRLTGIWTGKRVFELDNVRQTRDDFTRIDLSVTHYLTRNMELFTRIENLANEKSVGDEPDIDGTEWLVGINFRF